ncbi:unnamed protein product [Linum tenue]|uniref:Uncharacterized protein n=1 Tax=Linum tenue TaxID=586396 RepID=A0AAV0J1X7_9ROSI|nr:unnamed protein product [Linum tenue]
MNLSSFYPPYTDPPRPIRQHRAPNLPRHWGATSHGSGKSLGDQRASSRTSQS